MTSKELFLRLMGGPAGADERLGEVRRLYRTMTFEQMDAWMKTLPDTDPVYDEMVGDWIQIVGGLVKGGDGVGTIATAFAMFAFLADYHLKGRTHAQLDSGSLPPG